MPMTKSQRKTIDVAITRLEKLQREMHHVSERQSIQKAIDKLREAADMHRPGKE